MSGQLRCAHAHICTLFYVKYTMLLLYASYMYLDITFCSPMAHEGLYSSLEQQLGHEVVEACHHHRKLCVLGDHEAAYMGAYGVASHVGCSKGAWCGALAHICCGQF